MHDKFDLTARLPSRRWLRTIALDPTAGRSENLSTWGERKPSRLLCPPTTPTRSTRGQTAPEPRSRWDHHYGDCRFRIQPTRTQINFPNTRVVPKWRLRISPTILPCTRTGYECDRDNSCSLVGNFVALERRILLEVYGIFPLSFGFVERSDSMLSHPTISLSCGLI
jgi:hypothetical protein